MSLGHAPTGLPAITLADSIRDVLVDALRLDRRIQGPIARRRRSARRFRFAATTEIKEDRNVIGFFPGSDPEKKKEIVIYSAHYDHVGVNEKGEIHNGSDDNASGTSTLLEIAQAFGQGPRPARSVAFLWVSGEEKGLLGSHWFADHMNLPAGHKIVADINLDMVSRNDPKKIGVTPSPQARRLQLAGARRPVVVPGRGHGSRLRRRRVLLPHRQLQLCQQGHSDHLLLLGHSRRLSSAE